MYITLTKKKLFVILCISLTAFFVILQVASVQAEGITLSTNAQRVEYIKTLGVMVESDEYTSKNTVIPHEFGTVYSKYNALQKKANFDLSNYRGKSVTVFTYPCQDDKVVNLIIYKDKLIGGDIAETKINGSMVPLKEEDNG